MIQAVYFDMDGTIVDLYGVTDWQYRITHGDVSPYLEASPLVNVNQLRKLVKQLQKKNIHVGVLSWGARGSDLAFLKRTKQAKADWISGLGLSLDSIKVMPYGRSKHAYAACADSVLVDDSPIVRKQWEDAGMWAIDGETPKWLDFLLELAVWL